MPELQMAPATILNLLVEIHQNYFNTNWNWLWVRSVSFRRGEILGVMKVEFFYWREATNAIRA